MATFNKFHCFVEDLAEKVHNLGSDTLKVYLSNDAPATSDTIRILNGNTGNGPIEIAAGNGYTAGGPTIGSITSAQTSGTYKLATTANPQVTASEGSIGPFRYVVLYNDTSTNDSLIGWYDYGSPVTLAAGESFTIDFDNTNGILTIA